MLSRFGSYSGACGSLAAPGQATWVSAPLWLRWPLVLADLQRCDWVSVGIFWQLPCCLLLPLKPRSGGSSSSIVQDDKRKRRFKSSGSTEHVTVQAVQNVP